eukprot:m51a1_g553 hypothetical protein (287) ;mRNA; f:455609-456568
MPLLIDGHVVPPSASDSDLLALVRGAIASARTAAAPCAVRVLTYADRCLCATQGEAVRSRAAATWVGSDGASTCVVLCLRRPDTGATAAAHDAGAAGRVELHVCGARVGDDDRDASATSEANLAGALRGFLSTPVDVTLGRALVLADHSPGIAVAVGSGDVVRARFDDRGPELALRASRVSMGVAVDPVRAFVDGGDSDSDDDDVIAIPPFHPRVHAPVAAARSMLAMSDAELRESASTSPSWEDDRFAGDTRAAMQSIVDGVWRTAFPGGRPLLYRRGPQSWVRC